MHRRKMVVLSAIAAIAVSLGAPLSASAAPGDPATSTAPATTTETTTTDGTNGTGGETVPDMATLQQEIDKLNAEMLAAADAANQAVGQATVAKDAATQAKAELDAATQAAMLAQIAANQVAADLYMQGPMSLAESTLFSANGPQDFIDKVVLSDQVSDYQVAHISEAAAAKAEEEAASAAAETASADAQAKAEAAQKLSTDTQAKLAAAQTQMDALKLAAGIPTASSDAETPGMSTDSSGVTGQVTGEWALPTNGTFTSCFCGRWGTFHYGIDIANSIGTPIFAAGAGTVMRAGPANGFGLAVYIQHDNGDVTTYGHINEYFVQAGQRVAAGQHIADIGNRGYSTGPHLHFEVSKGMYGTRVDPQAWLAQRGINVG